MSTSATMIHAHGITVRVGDDGAWVEFRTKSGKHFAFQPAQEWGQRGGLGGMTIRDWCTEMQELRDQVVRGPGAPQLVSADLVMRLRGGRVPTYMEAGIAEALERRMREAADEIERLNNELAQWQANCTGKHGSQVSCGAEPTTVPPITEAVAKLRELGVKGPIRADLGKGCMEAVVPKARIRERIEAERATAAEIMSHSFNDERGRDARDRSADRHHIIADALEEVLENE